MGSAEEINYTHSEVINRIEQLDNEAAMGKDVREEAGTLLNSLLESMPDEHMSDGEVRKLHFIYSMYKKNARFRSFMILISDTYAKLEIAGKMIPFTLGMIEVLKRLKVD
jgi:hypothetical protein